ncbi:Protein of unknown function (DUF3736) [Branchiostoma belcheri]|nr:Protein of unknown function (DUF3736) [Branchiostoma belcheri]
MLGAADGNLRPGDPGRQHGEVVGDPARGARSTGNALEKAPQPRENLHRAPRHFRRRFCGYFTGWASALETTAVNMMAGAPSTAGGAATATSGLAAAANQHGTVCFVCGSGGAGYQLRSRPGADTAAAYFPFLEYHEAPPGGRSLAPDGGADVCFVCYSFLSEQWNSFERMRTPLAKRLYWLKRPPGCGYRSGHDAQLRFQQEELLKLNGQDAAVVGGDELDWPGYAAASARDDARNRDNTTNVTTNETTSALRLCYVCGHKKDRRHLLSAHTRPQHNPKSPFYPCLTRHAPPPGAASVDQDGTVMICEGCEKFLFRQWQAFQRNNIPVMERQYQLRSEVSHKARSSDHDTTVPQDRNPQEDDDTMRCFTCGVTQSLSSGRFIYARKHSNGDAFFPFLEKLTPPKGAMPLTAQGATRVCYTCRNSLDRQWKSFEASRTHEDERKYRVRKESAQKPSSPSNSQPLTKSAVSKPQGCYLCGSILPLSGGNVVNSKPPTSEEDDAPNVRYFPFLTDYPRASNAHPLKRDGTAQVCDTCQSWLDQQWHILQIRGVPPHQIGGFISNFMVLPGSSSSREETDVPRSSPVSDGDKTGTREEARKKCFICGQSITAGSSQQTVYTYPRTRDGWSDRGPFFPFLATCNPAPGADPVQPNGSVTTCHFCYHNLLQQWNDYEDLPRSPGETNRWLRPYHTRDFVCYWCAELRPFAVAKEVSVKHFPFLTDHPRPKGSLALEGGSSVLVCPGCHELMKSVKKTTDFTPSVIKGTAIDENKKTSHLSRRAAHLLLVSGDVSTEVCLSGVPHTFPPGAEYQACLGSAGVYKDVWHSPWHDPTICSLLHMLLEPGRHCNQRHQLTFPSHPGKYEEPGGIPQMYYRCQCNPTPYFAIPRSLATYTPVNEGDFANRSAGQGWHPGRHDVPVERKFQFSPPCEVQTCRRSQAHFRHIHGRLDTCYIPKLQLSSSRRKAEAVIVIDGSDSETESARSSGSRGTAAPTHVSSPGSPAGGGASDTVDRAQREANAEGMSPGARAAKSHITRPASLDLAIREQRVRDRAWSPGLVDVIVVMGWLDVVIRTRQAFFTGASTDRKDGTTTLPDTGRCKRCGARDTSAPGRMLPYAIAFNAYLQPSDQWIIRHLGDICCANNGPGSPTSQVTPSSNLRQSTGGPHADGRTAMAGRNGSFFLPDMTFSLFNLHPYPPLNGLKPPPLTMVATPTHPTSSVSPLHQRTLGGAPSVTAGSSSHNGGASSFAAALRKLAKQATDPPAPGSVPEHVPSPPRVGSHSPAAAKPPSRQGSSSLTGHQSSSPRIGAALSYSNAGERRKSSERPPSRERSSHSSKSSDSNHLPAVKTEKVTPGPSTGQQRTTPASQSSDLGVPHSRPIPHHIGLEEMSNHTSSSPRGFQPYRPEDIRHALPIPFGFDMASAPTYHSTPYHPALFAGTPFPHPAFRLEDHYEQYRLAGLRAPFMPVPPPHSAFLPGHPPPGLPISMHGIRYPPHEMITPYLHGSPRHPAEEPKNLSVAANGTAEKDSKDVILVKERERPRTETRDKQSPRMSHFPGLHSVQNGDISSSRRHDISSPTPSQLSNGDRSRALVQMEFQHQQYMKRLNQEERWQSRQRQMREEKAERQQEVSSYRQQLLQQQQGTLRASPNLKHGPSHVNREMTPNNHSEERNHSERVDSKEAIHLPPNSHPPPLVPPQNVHSFTREEPWKFHLAHAKHPLDNLRAVSEVRIPTTPPSSVAAHSNQYDYDRHPPARTSPANHDKPHSAGPHHTAARTDKSPRPPRGERTFRNHFERFNHEQSLLINGHLDRVAETFLDQSNQYAYDHRRLSELAYNINVSKALSVPFTEYFLGIQRTNRADSDEDRHVVSKLDMEESKIREARMRGTGLLT